MRNTKGSDQFGVAFDLWLMHPRTVVGFGQFGEPEAALKLPVRGSAISGLRRFEITRKNCWLSRVSVPQTIVVEVLAVAWGQVFAFWYGQPLANVQRTANSAVEMRFL